MALACWLVLVSGLVLALNWSKPAPRAVLRMAWGLILLWIFVYGLMVWLPAHWAPAERTAWPPRWWTYPLAVVAPALFTLLVPVLAPWILFTAKHPPIHFPPIH